MFWTQKTLYIRACVQRTPVKTKRSDLYPIMPLKAREFNHVYTLIDENGVNKVVCRDFFLQCLQINSSRVFSAIKSSTINPSAKETRGQGVPVNKTKEAAKNGVRTFINSIPKYESHYGRSSSQRKYLYHNLNLTKLYDEYKESRQFRNEHFVSHYIFSEIFNTEYNLSFKRRHTDTCRFCDEIKVVLQSALVSETRKIELRSEQTNHWTLVNKTHDDYKSDVKKARASDGKTVVLSFDLQKTLETPSLTTSVAFYKRQLWTYNLCVYNEGDRCAYMYMWSENNASRGAQEIGSCLLKHFKNHISSDVTEIIMWSDSCGGQNRNIKLAMLLKSYLHNLTPDDSLEIIKQKYYVSGHSYNSCDRCFGTIEKSRDRSSGIFTPNDWVNLVKSAQKPAFNVTVMQENDFVSTAELESLIVNRKKNSEGVKINWFNFRSLVYRKTEPFILNVICSDGKEQHIYIKKKTITEENLALCDIATLYPGGRAIAKKKFDDLMQLLKFVPPEHHNFYNDLKCDNEEDYGLASDNSET